MAENVQPHAPRRHGDGEGSLGLRSLPGLGPAPAHSGPAHIGPWALPVWRRMAGIGGWTALAAGALLYLFYLTTSEDKLAALLPKITRPSQSAPEGPTLVMSGPDRVAREGELARLSAEISELKKAVQELQGREAVLQRRFDDLAKELGLTTATLPKAAATANGRSSQPPVIVTYHPLPSHGFGDTRLDVSPLPIATVAPTQTQFAVELGEDQTVEALKARWAALQAQHGDLLAGLDTRHAPAAEGAATPGQKLRLLAGPFSNAADAVTLCLRLKSADLACKETVFAGERL